MKIIDKTCIVCPKGCKLTIEEVNHNDREIKVSGNGCSRGVEFAKAEMYNPMRTLQTTVKTTFKDCERLPVRTASSIPKDMMFKVMKEAKNVVIVEPLKMGDVVLKNVSGTGVDLIASQSIRLN